MLLLTIVFRVKYNDHNNNNYNNIVIILDNNNNNIQTKMYINVYFTLIP